MHSMRALLTLVLVAFVGAVILRSHRGAAQEAPPAEYVGKGKTCGMCHKEQHAAWSQTFHAKQKAASEAAADVKFRHMTGYDADGDKAEQGVSCQACHGPGGPHMKASLTAKKDSSINPQKLKDPLAAVALCGQCHSQGAMPDGTKYPKGYVPGKKLPEGYALAATVEGDTRLRQLNDMQQSKHVEKGVTCITCHTAHGGIKAKPQLRKPLNELCNDCHAAQADMTHAKDAKPDSKCGECHMPEKRHVFKAPPAA